MPTRIRFIAEGKEWSGELNDSETSLALLKRLPLAFRMHRWGDEYYGDIGEKLDVRPARDAREEMEIGELAYWMPGNALCVFFGPTPASRGDEPRAASPVHPLGRLEGSLEALKKLGPSIKARLELAERREPKNR